MSFGPIIKTTTKTGLVVGLAPFERDDAAQLAEGMQRLPVLQYIGMGAMAQTVGTEQEWYDEAVKKKNQVLWGIWVSENGSKKLIGTSAINEIGPHVESQPNITQGTTGVMITDPAYWGKGIASAAHKARTYFAFRQLGLIRLKSAVAQTNHASRKALASSGYFDVYTERNYQFINGKYIHEDNLECLNPDDWAWRLWWGDDRPTRKAVEARETTRQALEWAEQNVELP